MSKVIEITNLDQYETFKQAHRRGIIFYGAGWCHACKEIEPLYTRIANRYHKRIAMAHVDIDVCKLEFSKVPVFVSFRKGTQLDSMIGADNEGLKEFVKEAIAHDSHPKEAVKSDQTPKPSPSDQPIRSRKEEMPPIKTKIIKADKIISNTSTPGYVEDWQ